MTDESGQEHLPERRRHGYAELEKKLDDHARKLDTRLSEFIRRALIAFALIGFVSAGALVGFGILLREQGHTADEIQAQRRESILRSCVDQNVKHDNTIMQLNRLSAIAAAKRPEQAAQIKESTKSSVILIEALVPKKDCLKLVDESVGRE